MIKISRQAANQNTKHILKQILRQFILPVTISTIILTIGFFFLNGIPLTGIPKADDLTGVEILNLNVSTTPHMAVTSEEIELAVNIAGFLDYELGAPDGGEASVIITYHKKDGSTEVLSANADTVFWRNKAHKIKNHNGQTFINIVEGVFFKD